MSKSKWVEVSCDSCGSADYFRPGNVDSDARKEGWIVTSKGKHYCNNPCKPKRRGIEQ